MTAYAETTTDRRGFLKLALVGVGGAILVRALSVPELGEVIVGDHAVARHGIDAAAVRAHYAAMKTSAIFGQPRCRDGRYRIATDMGGGDFAVWVLIGLADGLYQEVTAFTTRNQDYIRAMRDDCGNGGWFGFGSSARNGRREDEKTA